MWLSRLVRGAVVAGSSVLLVSVAACSSPDLDTGPAPGPSTASSSPTIAEGGFPSSQQEYTKELVERWAAGDRAGAQRYADSYAVDALFSEVRGLGWVLAGCDNAGPRPACTYRHTATGERVVLFYDAEALGRPGAVVAVEFLAPS